MRAARLHRRQGRSTERARRFGAFWLAVCALAVLGASPRLSVAATTGDSAPLAAAVLVVYNTNYPDAEALAGYYADRRGIDRARLLGLDLPNDEEIDRDAYDARLAEPLRAAFARNGWWHEDRNPDGGTVVTANAVRFVVLIRGVPLKVRFRMTYPGDHPDPKNPAGMRNEAAVDSELALLGYRNRQISGPVKNPYFRSYQRITDPGSDPRLMLVARLDGPTANDVRRMIDDGLAAEKTGLWGWTLIDERATTDPAYKVGDDWLENLAAEADRLGRPTLVDRRPELIPSGFPLPDVALYFGWYAENAGGALADPGFNFQPGAIAVHLHSFSGATVRAPDRHWVGPLIRHGAAATLGNVYEPFLGLTPTLDVFFDRLINGMTFAESAYASLVGLSWMTTVVGDPLYRPFGDEGESPRGANPWRVYRSLVLNNAGAPDRLAAALLAQAPREPRFYEWAAQTFARAGRVDDAVTAFLKARRAAKSRADRLRPLLEALSTLRARGRAEDAGRLARREGGEFRDEVSQRLLSEYGVPNP